MSKPTIMVVEDNPELRDALSDTLEYDGYSVIAVADGESALQVLERQSIGLVVTDINMDGMDGHALLMQIRRRHPVLPVILITAFGSIGSSVRAMREGAVDYLLKPFKPEQLLSSIEKYLAPSVAGSADPIAVDAVSQQLLSLARRVAQSDATVLVSGESGTGKEVLAQYIHRHSRRSDGPFIAINCAAIPDNMLEATLFGHEKGAFTGAYQSSPGKFEQADGGTLLLDEISEMDIALQAKILRVLQEREVERVGGRKTLSLDVRVIATTNRDLRDCVREGTFREDLYYRLSVFPLAWQPLRNRPRDIVPLAERLLQYHGARMARGAVQFTDDGRQALINYSWPGNVRELDNVVQRALIIQEGTHIGSAALALADTHPASLMPLSALKGVGDDASARQEQNVEGETALGSDLRRREFELILATLREKGGRRKETAEALGVSARTLRYKLARMRDMGINIEAPLGA